MIEVSTNGAKAKAKAKAKAISTSNLNYITRDFHMYSVEIDGTNEIFNYKIEYSKRRKCIACKYLAKNTALILAPAGLSVEDVQKGVKLSSGKFYYFLAEQDRTASKADGLNKIYFLGELYEIKLTCNGNTFDATFDRRLKTVKLNLHPNSYANRNSAEIKKVIKYKIKNAIMIEAVTFIRNRYNGTFDAIAKAIGCTDPKPLLAVKECKGKWGSYNKRTHKIVVNGLLMQASLDEIDCVLVHEICHILQMNHSSKFYALMSKAMHNHRDVNNKLKSRNRDYNDWFYKQIL